MLRISILVFIMAWFSNSSLAQAKPTSKLSIARKAFDSWGIGERTGNYDAFKKLLSADFSTYAHPLSGRFEGKEALRKMNELIAEREKNSNALEFSNIKVMEGSNEVAFAFDSEGKVAGGYPYKGFNIIVFSIQKGKVTGFREYFGFVDPAWFR